MGQKEQENGVRKGERGRKWVKPGAIKRQDGVRRGKMGQKEAEWGKKSRNGAKKSWNGAIKVIPALWSNIASNNLTMLIFEQFIVAQRIIIGIFRDRRVISQE